MSDHEQKKNRPMPEGDRQNEADRARHHSPRDPYSGSDARKDTKGATTVRNDPATHPRRDTE